MKRMPWKISREMFLSLKEVDALLRNVRSGTGESFRRRQAVVDRLIIEGLLFSGLRNSEFCALRLGDATVGQAFRVRGRGDVERIVEIPWPVSELVRFYAAEVRPLLLSGGADPTDMSQPLLINERGRQYERTALYRRVVRILRAAGLGERSSVQLLRHTYGYLAYLRTGGNLLFVQRQLGHAHPMITSIYAEFVEESYQHLADKLYQPFADDACAACVTPAAGESTSE